MQSCLFLESVSESGPGKFSAARPAAVSSAELPYSRSGPCFRNHREMLAMVFSRARLRKRLSWMTLILLRHVLSIHRHFCEDG